jgi:hypothetical protein
MEKEKAEHHSTLSMLEIKARRTKYSSNAGPQSTPFALFLSALIGLNGLSLFFPLSASSNQKQFYQTTTNTNNQGSDDSLENSAVYAMSALMDLSSLNYRSALNNGLTAYGKYRNSETMDRISKENAILALSMGTIGEGAKSESASGSKANDGSGASGVSGSTQTSFRRLDSKFLREGKAAQVAAEFEKRSGMSREKFLEQLSTISEQKLSRHDPQLVEKAIGRFENFIKQIPNGEFRAGLQKAVNNVPATVRSGVIAKAVSRFASLTGGSVASSGSESDGIDAQVAAKLSSSTQETPSIQDQRTPAKLSSKDNGVEKRDLASEVTSGLPGAHLSLGSEGSNSAERDAIGSIVKAAIDTQSQELTVFQIVNRKYRSLTPKLNP